MRQSWNIDEAVYLLDGFRRQSHFWAFCAFIYLSWRDIPAATHYLFSAAGTWLIASDQKLQLNQEIPLEFWSNSLSFGAVLGNLALCFGVSFIFRKLCLLHAPSIVEAVREREALIKKTKSESKLLERELRVLKDSVKLAKQLNKTQANVVIIHDEIKGIKTELVSTKRAFNKLSSTPKPKAPVNDLFVHQSLPIANLPTQKKPKRRFFQKSKPEGYDF